MSASPVPLFSPPRYHAQAERRRRMSGDANFLAPVIAESLGDRLSMIARSFAAPLLIADAAAPWRDLTDAVAGPVAHVAMSPALTAHGAQGLLAGFAEAAFDLILWPTGFELVNDLPGALLGLRRLLRPDGLLLGSYVGDGSLPRLRRALAAEGMRAIARMHPQIDLATAGDLLQRTGFALPVVDVEPLTLRYATVGRLIGDLRATGLGNCLTQASPPLRRAEVRTLADAFDAQADSDGRVGETLRIVHFQGWAPHPGQPQPARRGSATASLAEALRRGDDPPVMGL